MKGLHYWPNVIKWGGYLFFFPRFFFFFYPFLYKRKNTSFASPTAIPLHLEKQSSARSPRAVISSNDLQEDFAFFNLLLLLHRPQKRNPIDEDSFRTHWGQSSLNPAAWATADSNKHCDMSGIIKESSACDDVPDTLDTRQSSSWSSMSLLRRMYSVQFCWIMSINTIKKYHIPGWVPINKARVLKLSRQELWQEITRSR